MVRLVPPAAHELARSAPGTPRGAGHATCTQLRSLAAALPLAERQALELRWGLHGPRHSYEAIACACRVSAVEVRRLERSGFLRLRRLVVALHTDEDWWHAADPDAKQV